MNIFYEELGISVVFDSNRLRVCVCVCETSGVRFNHTTGCGSLTQQFTKDLPTPMNLGIIE